MTPTIISLPAQFNGVSLSKLASAALADTRKENSSVVIFDFAELKFIRPAGVVFLSNLIYWLSSKDTKVHFRNFKRGTPPLYYLDNSLFFERHLGTKLRPQASPSETTRPLLKIAHKDSHEWLDSNLLPWLAKRLAITEASLYDLKSCLSELFNNIQDHTEYDIGSMFVQHFPAEKSVEIALSDFGAGIPNNVKTKLANLDDSTAIIKATEEGFTTKSRPTNAGLGLDQLLKTVVLRNGGSVTIYSLNGMVRFNNKHGKILPEPFKKVGFCPGTTIEINLRTDTIDHLPDSREELEW